MRSCVALLVLLLGTTVGCSHVALRKGPDSWKEDDAPYSIQPTSDGKLMPDGWRLDNFDPSAEGFRKQHHQDGRDLLWKRTADDGVFVVVTETTKPEDADKKAAVFLDRWIGAVVESPHISYGTTATLDGRAGIYDDVVAPLKNGVPAGPNVVALNFRRDVETKNRADFEVPGGDGSEALVHATPRAAGVAQSIYAAAVRPKGQDRVVFLAYSNTESQFEAGATDAAAFARRIRFP
jgi:hypothetical protein